MEKQPKPLYEFGEFQLDCGEKLLRRGEELVPLKAKGFDLLVLLVENAGRLLEKEWLMGELWPESFVEEVNLNVHISTLRKALGETATAHRYIETVPKRGYRFVAKVTQKRSGGEETAPRLADIQNDLAPETARSLPEEAIAVQAVEPETLPEEAGKNSSASLPPPLLQRSGQPSKVGPWQVAVLLLLLVGLGAAGLFLMRSSNVKSSTQENLKSVAVLPFKTLSKDEADSALAVGMADAIITKIGSLKKINVRPTSAVLKYSDSAEDSIAIGKQLQVDVILEGLVQRSDKKVRITAKLIRVQDGSPLWSDTFDDYFTNIFALQDSISQKMAQALSVQISENEHQLLAKRYTENTDAYQMYLLGQYSFYNQVDGKNLDKPLGYYQAAINKDSDFAPAWVGLADVYYTKGENLGNRQEMREKAQAALTRALEIDANLAEAVGTLSVLRLTDDFNWAESERLIKRAIELKPNDAHAHESYARLLTQMGRCQEARQENLLALQFDPVSDSAKWNNCYSLIVCGNYDEALEMGRKAHMEEVSPTQWFYMNIQICAAKSQFAQAIAEAKKLDAQSPILKRNNVLGYCFGRNGNRAEAEAIIQERLKGLGQPGVIANYYNNAMVYAGLGDKDHAFASLEKSFQEKEYMLLYLKVDCFWEGLRSDPRYKDLLRRINLES